jgi:hypothetical protein
MIRDAAHAPSGGELDAQRCAVRIEHGEHQRLCIVREEHMPQQAESIRERLYTRVDQIPVFDIWLRLRHEPAEYRRTLLDLAGQIQGSEL